MSSFAVIILSIVRGNVALFQYLPVVNHSMRKSKICIILINSKASDYKFDYLSLIL
jgi:hypothetical protein